MFPIPYFLSYGLVKISPSLLNLPFIPALRRRGLRGGYNNIFKTIIIGLLVVALGISSFSLVIKHKRTPPLRERKEDIELLVGHFLDVFKTKTNAKKISPDAMDAFVNYNWPGNVRELKNTIERLVILTDGDLIEAKDLPSNLQVSAPYPRDEKAVELPLPEVERRHILSVLTEKKGSKTLAAEALGISLKTLYNKLKAYNIP